MNCPKCKAAFAEGVKFCPECGTRVSTASSAVELKSGVEVSGVDHSQMTREVAGEVAAPVGLSKKALGERYELLEKAGEGGFGVVWRARDKDVGGKIMAVKRLHAGKDVRAQERFEREAFLISGLNHRNIVRVSDCGKDEEGPWIVMDWVGGGTLKDLLKQRGKLPVEEAISLARGVARGLAHAHGRNLVHRDIKPANIMLDRDGEEWVPMIVDFGLARAGMDSGASLTGYGMGTPYYMSPEQRRDAKSVNQTADIYALGKTIYEMLTGEVPDAVDPEKVPSPELLRILLRCCKARPEERYFSVGDLLRDFDNLKGETKAGVVRAAGAAGENTCPQCQVPNAEDVKFCGGCGAGLTRQCPECERENPVRRKYCGSCGTEVEGFDAMKEILARMERATGNKEWSCVLKEAGLAKKEWRLQGKKGAKMMGAVERLRQQAEGTLAERDLQKQKLEKAVAEKAWEVALAIVRTLENLGPEAGDYSPQREDLVQKWDGEDWARVEALDGSADTAQALEQVLEAYSVYERRHPSGRHAAEVGQIMERVREKMETMEWGEAKEACSRLAGMGDFDEAIADCESLVRKYPNGKHRQAIKKTCEELRAAKEEEDWAQTKEIFTREEGERNLVSAAVTVSAYLEKHSNGAHRAEAEAEKARWEEVAREAMTLSEEAGKRLAEDQVEKAIVGFEKALALNGELAEAQTQLSKARRLLGQWRQIRSEAEKCRSEGRLQEAAEKFMEAVELRPGDEEARAAERACLKAIIEQVKTEAEALAAAAQHHEALERLEVIRVVAEEDTGWKAMVMREKQVLAALDAAVVLAGRELDAGHPRKSLRACREALAWDPDHGKAGEIARRAQILIQRNLWIAGGVTALVAALILFLGIRSFQAQRALAHQRYTQILALVARVREATSSERLEEASKLIEEIEGLDATNSQVSVLREEVDRRTKVRREQVLELVKRAREEMNAERLEETSKLIVEIERADAKNPQVSVLREEVDRRTKALAEKRILEMVKRAREAVNSERLEDASKLIEEIERADAKNPQVSVLREEVDRRTKARVEKMKRERILAASRMQPFENGLGMKFVPAGTPGVLFCVWETRVKDYGAFARATNRPWEKPSFSQGEDHPAVNVSWDDATAFCKWLSEKEGQEYRLPTSAEWSMAVGDGKYPWGDEWPPPKGAGNYDSSRNVDDYANTSPAGSFAPNRYGLYDMGGNVWEWCQDGEGNSRWVRGGSWGIHGPALLASSCRVNFHPAFRHVNFGFRCVLAVRSSR